MAASTLDALTFCKIPAAVHALGWRFDDQLSPDVAAALDGFAPRAGLLTRFSSQRRVELPEFEIAIDSVALEHLLGDPYAFEDDFETLYDVCEAVDAVLRPAGLRLPSEDELEAACGGALYWWGMETPDGIPYGDETTFTRHLEPNGRGLVLNGDTYVLELVRYALKLGDGGAAICGAYPWPIAWLSLSPSWRLRDVDVSECLVEHLETARIRPVRVGS